MGGREKEREKRKKGEKGERGRERREKGRKEWERRESRKVGGREKEQASFKCIMYIYTYSNQKEQRIWNFFSGEYLAYIGYLKRPIKPYEHHKSLLTYNIYMMYNIYIYIFIDHVYIC